MTALAHSTERYRQSVVERHTQLAILLIFKAIFLVVLLPITVFVAIIVLIDVGFPLVTWTRVDDGSSSQPATSYKFRTTKLDLQNISERRVLRSKIGQLLTRCSLDRLPNMYFSQSISNFKAF